MVSIQGSWIIDQQGRTIMLRGVNLGGSSKVPARPNGATHIREGFFDHQNVSFVGRPFPLAEADGHFQRLQAWGFNFLRILVTWEAIEHTGPGLYDEEYLDYLRQVVMKAGEYGFFVLIDPHQDVWSRFSGGDGAPGWTLEAVGLNLAHFHETAAAIVHQVHGDPFPQMIWPTNGTRLAAATMFTLFFAGNDFAPHTQVAGEPVQDYLQRHYIAAFQQVAQKLCDLDHVIGYEVINEPMRGFIGLKDLTKPALPVKFGPMLTPLQSMILGSGISQEIEVWQRTLFRSQLVERRLFNPKQFRIWREGYDGIWNQNGIWELNEKNQPRLLKPHHFWQVNGRGVDFSQDYLRPFANRFAEGIRAIDPDALIFLETDPLLPPPAWSAEDAPSIIYAPHWYDATILFLKTFSPWIGFDIHKRRIILGKSRVQRSFVQQLATYKNYSAQYLNNAPVVIGETGIAYDLNHKRAYQTGNFKQQVQAMDRTLRAMEANLLSFTLWNYTPDNDNNRGDQWNGEDLSIFSRDQQTDPNDINSGGRALQAILRPYPRATAGEPLHLSFDARRRIFSYQFRHNPIIQAPTEIYVPDFQYPRGYNIWISDGECDTAEAGRLLFFQHNPKREIHLIRITPR